MRHSAKRTPKSRAGEGGRGPCRTLRRAAVQRCGIGLTSRKLTLATQSSPAHPETPASYHPPRPRHQPPASGRRLGPGEMVAVDLATGEFLDSAAIDSERRLASEVAEEYLTEKGLI